MSESGPPAGEHLAGEQPGAVPAGLFESFIPRERRAALADGRRLPHRVEGAALFADISGFTALAEALVTEHGRQRGAEEVDTNLNRVYEAIIDDLAAYHGEVIYLSGDAITCWLDGDDGSRAVRCGLDMQHTMRRVGNVATAHGPIELSIKVAVAAGRARRFVVGAPEHQRMDVLAGRLVDDLAAAESQTHQGEVVADQSVLDVLGDRLVTLEERRSAHGRRCAVVGDLVGAPRRNPPLPLVDLPVEIVRPWIVPDVFARLAVGAGTLLAELRSAYPIFVRFGGFDYDADVHVAGAVDEFVRAVQDVLDRLGGTLLGITVGDKGAYLNAVMGALASHEDDALRAVTAALQIRDLEASTPASGIQVGVSHGPIYAGTYGHTHRRTYSVLGDPTNTAARLMVAAPPGEVYVAEAVAASVDDRFRWAAVEPLRLKGKAELVAVRAPVAPRRRPARRVTRYELPMVGRDRELAVVRDVVDATCSGSRQLVSITADAGMGKSRFVAELLRYVDDAGVAVAYGQADSLGQTTSYVVWQDVWRRLLGLDDEHPDAAQAAEVTRLVHLAGPLLSPRAPLLGTVLGIEFPDNEVTRSFDAKLRKTSLENLLGDLLVDRLRAGPLVIVLEDLQWIDPPSIDLLAELVRRTDGLPVMFVLSFRREPAFVTPEEILRLPGLQQILLTELDRSGMESVVAAKVTQVFGGEAVVSAPVVDLVLDRAQGNPFYAEELVNYFHRLGLDPATTDATAIELPATLHAIVLERIDALEERPRQAVKVASVAGRSFPAPMIGTVHAPLGGPSEVLGHLEVARSVDLVIPEDEDLVDWLFRHAITQEVAYESLPFAVRRTMHERIGDHLAADAGSTALAGLIAHHYWHSDDLGKQRRWLRLAGDAARAAYANEEAIRHYDRLAQVAPDDERAQVLLDLTSVHELVGDWDTAEQCAAEARLLADGAGDGVTAGWCDVALAEIERKRGRYEGAVDLLALAWDAFDRASDGAGVARVAHLRGTIAAQQGDLAEAREHYEASRAARERTGDLAGLASILSNLGVVAEYEGDFASARGHHQRALDLRREVGDRWAIAVSYTNLGMIAALEGRHEDARRLFTDALRLNAEVGDTWMVAIAHNNLGNAHRGLGRDDDARSHYAAALATMGPYRDRWALAFLVEDIARLALGGTDRDVGVALGLLATADRWRSEIDAPRPASSERDIADRLAAAGVVTVVGEGWSDDEALVAALRFCNG